MNMLGGGASRAISKPAGAAPYAMGVISVAKVKVIGGFGLSTRGGIPSTTHVS